MKILSIRSAFTFRLKLHKRIWMLIFINLLLLQVAIPIQAQTSKHLTIQGALIDEGNTPYAFNPVVLVADSAEIEGQTDYQGNFTLSGIVTGSSGILVLKSTYGDEVLAEVPVVWGSANDTVKINLGEATVSLKERRFVGATEFVLPDMQNQLATDSTDGQQADLMSEPVEQIPAAIESRGSNAIGEDVTTRPVTSSDSQYMLKDSPDPDPISSTVVTPAEVPLRRLAQNKLTSTNNQPTPSQVNRTGAAIAMAILVILGLSLVGGGVIAAKRSQSARVRVKVKG